MTRSRKRKLKRNALAAAVVTALSTPAFAQEAAQQSGVLEEVLVTAQKRTENLQEVPLSIQAIGTERLEELHVKGFEDYVKYLPSVSYQTFGPGFAQVYMRGVASGGDGNHSGSQPSVGIYLDEQPITTIQGALDVQPYDVARVEALAGPQGTLYGASSQAGTIRIITNKPDATQFAAGYDLEGSTMTDGGNGYLVQGFANLPINDSTAVRLVGWKRHDPGFIDNVSHPRTFPSSVVTGIGPLDVANPKDDYNDADTTGGRAALKFDLNDSWSITPQIMAQEQKTRGTFGFDPSVGDLKVSHRFPEKSKDRWYQAALTVEGKIANLDITYAGGYLNRKVDTESDYSDYSYWYDVYYDGLHAADPDAYGRFGTYFYDDDGGAIDISQYIQGKDRYRRYTHELRFATPAENRLRFVGGLFAQRQVHDIEQRYLIGNLAAELEVTGWPDTIWLTEQERIDRDQAIFGELSYDITDKLTVTGGARWFEAENSLQGYFGFGDGFSGSGKSGETLCSFLAGDLQGDTSSWVPFVNKTGTAPCTNLQRRVDEKDTIGKVNVSYKFDSDRMVYATWSRGYRPGGVNRFAGIPPYLSDFLDNYEVGWKTTWGGNFRWNGALFTQNWDNFQFSFLGQNGLTIIQNSSKARINGLEMDAEWQVGGGLALTGGVAFIDSELKEDYCGIADPVTSKPITSCPAGVDSGIPDIGVFQGPQATKGQELPVSPKFKGNVTARYTFPLGNFDAHVQGAYVYAGKRWADLRTVERAIIGQLDAYSIVDFTAGIDNGTYSFELFVGNAFDERAEITRFAQCAEAICGSETYVVTNPPRTFGVRFGQKF
ncbi:MAG TPA: TonB-dependent receptor [Steroidobacteraceae bacterium]|jgi:iron complex outermembrane receptor protein|nr:TonB-dependent receptor [Steroidobacteraceae bacterium]